MIAKTHRSFAFTAATGSLLLANQFTPIFEGVEPKMAVAQAGVITAVAVTTSILPDFDRVIPFIRHRGITHSLWAILLIGYFTWNYQADPKKFALLFGLFIGYTSHIVGDAFSSAGIAWLYPLQGYKGYDGGAFHVKGFRGPFQPLYKVGQKTFIPPTFIWYGIGLVFALNLIIKLA